MTDDAMPLMADITMLNRHHDGTVNKSTVSASCNIIPEIFQSEIYVWETHAFIRQPLAAPPDVIGIIMHSSL